MTFKEVRDTYWKYYISLEEEFLDTSKYVEFDYINNGRTYSIEYLKLFQTVCSEIDVVGKALAKELDSTFSPTKKTGINEWWYSILENDTGIIDKKCALFGEHSLQPWKGFRVVKNDHEGAKKYILGDNAKTPSWWNDYNSVKHNRTGHFERHSLNYSKANLKNLFFAFAALYSLEIKLMASVRMNNETVPTSLESHLFTEHLTFYTYLLRVN